MTANDSPRLPFRFFFLAGLVPSSAMAQYSPTHQLHVLGLGQRALWWERNYYGLAVAPPHQLGGFEAGFEARRKQFNRFTGRAAPQVSSPSCHHHHPLLLEGCFRPPSHVSRDHLAAAMTPVSTTTPPTR